MRERKGWIALTNVFVLGANNDGQIATNRLKVVAAITKGIWPVTVGWLEECRAHNCLVDTKLN